MKEKSTPSPSPTSPKAQQVSLSIKEALHNYMRDLNGDSCTHLYKSTLVIVEKSIIEFSLQHCNGNLSAAAKLLGMSRTTLSRKTAAYNIKIKNNAD